MAVAAEYESGSGTRYGRSRSRRRGDDSHSDWYGSGASHHPPPAPPPPGPPHAAPATSGHYAPPPAPHHAQHYGHAAEDPYGSSIMPYYGAGAEASKASRKSSGKGKGQTMLDRGLEAYSRTQSLPRSLVLANVPIEFNTLDSLNRHFRNFGEVLKITVHANDGRASIQFSTREAAEAAAQVQVFGRRDIIIGWAPRVPGKGRPKGSGGDAKSGDGTCIGSGTGPKPENRVLVSDPVEQKRMDGLRQKREEVAAQKSLFLGKLTEQIKVIMTKLNDDTLPEDKKETMRALMLQLKGKLDSFSAPAVEAVTTTFSKGKGKDGRSNIMDNRPTVLQFSLDDGFTLERLADELRKVGAAEHRVAELLWAPQHDIDATKAADVETDGSTRTALVRFKERWQAEQVFSQRPELLFCKGVEWSNVSQAAALADDVPSMAEAEVNMTQTNALDAAAPSTAEETPATESATVEEPASQQVMAEVA